MTEPTFLIELQHALKEGGLMGGLTWLNRRVPHRYTVVYRFDGEAFYTIALVDKLGEPMPDLFVRVPFEDSFCQFSIGIGQFKTADSVKDQRLDGHLHQATVQSYVGLPLTRPLVGLYGTFCHLDLVPQVISDTEFAFLQQAAPLVAEHLPATTAKA
ncbi:MAG: hypothetical protein EOP39_23440 [Rubrivivax sp.]|nr:MAG: hypothetical protein EOP39_23440 [Rubrivivax sp.]